MLKTFLMHLAGRHRTPKSDTQLGVLLAFLAGAINAGGFMAIGYYTSHMTGIVSAIADYIALHKFSSALLTFFFLFSFLCGAITSSIIINMARARHCHGEFAWALMLEALLLLVFGLSATNAMHSFALAASITICTICFIMGLQNAIITKISRAEIRTTHVTGIVTDIGIETGRFLYSFTHPGQGITVNFTKLRLHAMLLTAFLTGGISGALAFKHEGFITTVPLAFILAIVAIVPIAEDIRSVLKRS
ncbi:DUF1275 domain-containing protein [bacterium]|nr:DUF1275 domain-containing protein [bacterium]